MIEILEIEINGSNWNDFRFMDGFYKKVDEKIETEYFRIGFLAKSNASYLGRIGCYINSRHLVDGNPSLTFGNFECIEDYMVFEKLVKAVVSFAKSIDINNIIGPMNGSSWGSYRFVSVPQPDPFLLEPVTVPYYYDFFKRFGFSKLASYYSQKTDVMIDNWDKNRTKYDHFLEMGVTFDSFDRENPNTEFNELSDFCNAAFKNNFLFSPITNTLFIEKMMPTLPLIDSKYTIIARHLGKIVGFMFSYQDKLNQAKKTLVLKTLARDLNPEYEGMGSVLSSLIMLNAIKDGYSSCIHALMFENNISKLLSGKFNGTTMRTYELLKLKL